MDKTLKLSRRNFMKTSAATIAGLGLHVIQKSLPVFAQNIPQATKLGRVAVGGDGAHFDLKLKPDMYSNSVGQVFHDDIIPWYREVAASGMDLNSVNQRWIETDGGYIYAGYVQPVKDIKNQPITSLPNYGTTPGMWVEITVPYSDLTLDGPPGSYWLKHTFYPRAYYGQVFWADRINQTSDGKIVYRMTQRVGCQEEYYYTAAEACKVLTPDDIAPINPDIQDKKVVVNLKHQTLACIENGKEIFFTRVSTGPKGEKGWATTPGDHPIWRKCVSMHMSANGATGEGFDTSGIGWTTLFTTSGAAIHSAYWHNEFGFARSHGCVNCLPEDAKFVWRWTTPVVQYDPGDLIWNDWQSGSTRIVVVEE
jgi:hypothetical protein